MLLQQTVEAAINDRKSDGQRGKTDSALFSGTPQLSLASPSEPDLLYKGSPSPMKAVVTDDVAAPLRSSEDAVAVDSRAPLWQDHFSIKEEIRRTATTATDWKEGATEMQREKTTKIE